MAKLNNTTTGNNVYSALKLTLYKHVANNYEKLNNLEEKLLKIQDFYIDGDLSKEEYQKAKIRYQNLINQLREKEKHLEKKEEFFQLYKNGLKGI